MKDKILISDEDRDLLDHSIYYDKCNKKFCIIDGGKKYLNRIIAKRMGLTGRVTLKDKNPFNLRRDNLISIKFPAEPILSDEDKDIKNVYFSKRLNRFREKYTEKFLHKIVAERMGLQGFIKFKDNNPFNCRRDNLIELRDTTKPLLSKEDEDLLNAGFYYHKSNNKFKRVNHKDKYLHRVIAKRMGLVGTIKFRDGDSTNCRRTNLYAVQNYAFRRRQRSSKI